MFLTEPQAATLIEGDCLAALAGLPTCSIDAIVTDPPYHLTQASRNGSPRKNDPETPFGRTRLGSKGFMGKTWDGGGIAFEPATWAEALRVAKPGCHLLAFGGTRTFHRLAVAIEDAGWEIRDTIMWVYGQGFPKGLDVSKAIDKAAGAEREVVGSIKKSVSGMAPGEGNWSDDNYQWQPEFSITATDAAKRWKGWDTALKPAWEPIILARKPLIGTVAANVVEHGCGGINVDGCRVGYQSEADYRRNSDFDRKQKTDSIFWHGDGQNLNRVNSSGRWPANLVHDGSEEVVGLFPQTNRSGKERSGVGQPYNGLANSGKAFKQAQPKYHDFGDSGSAARFFYCAKASRKERGEGNKHPTVKPLALMEWLVKLVTPPGGLVLDPFMGSGTTGVAAVGLGFRFCGIEIEAESCATARERIAECIEIAANRLRQEVLFGNE